MRGRSSREARWEALCHQCGKCCYEKDYAYGTRLFINYAKPCELLDEETNLCRDYDHRFEKCPQCKKMTLGRALFAPYLPADCGYVVAFRRWRRFLGTPVAAG